MSNQSREPISIERQREIVAERESCREGKRAREKERERERERAKERERDREGDPVITSYIRLLILSNYTSKCCGDSK